MRTLLTHAAGRSGYRVPPLVVAYVWPTLRDSRCRDFGEALGFLAEHKLGIAELPHLRNVEACNFSFCRNPLAEEELERKVQQEAECENKSQQSRDTDELSSKLAGVTIEQASDRTSHAVPASAIIARAICEQSDREHAP